MENSRSKLLRLALPLLVLLVVVGGLIYRRDISDWWRLRDYKPNSTIVGLAKSTTMTAEGKKLFYVSHPDIYGKIEFNQNCNFNELSIILGCYVSKQGLYGDIYLYNIKDTRLEGVVEVTAAHEMLHVAYERLSDSEKDRIDALLSKAYKKITDKRLTETINQYKKQDPSSVPNELHSILATEVRNLSPELEAYYQRYFTDRKKVVSFSEQYEAEFTKRRVAVEQYDRQLSTLKAEIEAEETTISQRLSELRQEQAELEQTRSSDEPSEYNATVAAFNQSVGEYNALVSTTRKKIATHNNMVARRNEAALEAQELAKAIDSRPKSL